MESSVCFVPLAPSNLAASASKFVSSKIGSSFLSGENACSLSGKSQKVSQTPVETVCATQFALEQGVEKLVPQVSKEMKIINTDNGDFGGFRRESKFEQFKDGSISVLPFKPRAISARIAPEESGLTKVSTIFSTDYNKGIRDVEAIIEEGYRVVFGAPVSVSADRQPSLDSLFRNGKITTKEFLKGLVLSDAFQRKVYEPSSNYRFVEVCIQRILGREAYNRGELMAWAVMIGSKGYEYFVDMLFASDEYNAWWGENEVPYQRARELYGPREFEEVPFQLRPAGRVIRRQNRLNLVPVDMPEFAPRSLSAAGLYDFFQYDIKLSGTATAYQKKQKKSIVERFAAAAARPQKFSDKKVTFYDV